MEAVSTAWKCARCCVSPHPFLDGEDGARSRQTMDGREPTIWVCTDCREREVFGRAAGLPAIPFDRWPVPLDHLLAEDRERYAYRRAERCPGGGVTVDPGQDT